MSAPHTDTSVDHLAAARRVLVTEAAAVGDLVDQLDDSFGQVVEEILHSSGRVLVTGMGKSGLVGRKISATFASTGTPSFFMHPAEALHGDFGMVDAKDCILALSYSGETDEVLRLIPLLRTSGNTLVAMTGDPGSTLARHAKYHVRVAVAKEACALRLAPTSSTTAALAMGDALAVALMEARGFAPADFARLHPSGNLGRRLLARVEDEMVTEALPLVTSSADLLTVLSTMSRGRLGIAIVERDGTPGIITDGDIRRTVEAHGHEAFTLTAAEIMTREAKVVPIGTMIEDALTLMHTHHITSLLVLDDGGLAGVFRHQA
jgi:arabinose-5-phosphate isomerase